MDNTENQLEGPQKTQQVQSTSVNRVYSSGLQESQSANDYPGNKKHFFQTGKWAKGLAPAEAQSFYKSFTSGHERAGLSLLLRSQWFTRFVQRRTFVLFIVCQLLTYHTLTLINNVLLPKVLGLFFYFGPRAVFLSEMHVDITSIFMSSTFAIYIKPWTSIFTLKQLADVCVDTETKRGASWESVLRPPRCNELKRIR